MLPETLLWLISAALVAAQTRQQLPINVVSPFTTQKLPNPPSFSLPAQDQLAVSIALCSNSNSPPRFFISNGSNSDPDPGPSLGSNVFEISLDAGQGTFTGKFASGGVLAVDFDGNDDIPFEIGVSTSDPLHQFTNELPFFGDTTSNQAIIFSPPFETLPINKPSFPNYTLPSALNPQPGPPSSSPNLTLIVSPTSLDVASGIRTGCFLASQRTTGTLVNQTVWARDKTGFRGQWLLAGLTPSTNYTAFTLQDTTKVSGPIYFATKSAAFPCSLAHSLSYCPSVAYSVPIPQPPGGAATYDDTNLPEQVKTPLLSYIANFTTVLTTFACGRDWYSPIVGCDDCQYEYRNWLCSISFSRCSEPSLSNPNGFTAVPAPPEATGLSASRKQDASGVQQVLSALAPQPTRSQPRNSNLPSLGTSYSMLLPCLEQCNVVDRACPPFIGFKCPTNNFNAAASYGVGYIDSADGDKDKGLTGVAQDRWGNVWCNLI